MENIKITQLDDKQLDELLAYAPMYSTQNSENIKSLFLQKASVTSAKPARRGAVKRVLLVAAVAALTLAVSITALAATGVIDFGGFYNSIFNNPEASPYVIYAETALSDDYFIFTEPAPGVDSESVVAPNDGDITLDDNADAEETSTVSDEAQSVSIEAPDGSFTVTGCGVDVPGSAGLLTVEPVAALWDGENVLFIQLKLTAENELQLPDELWLSRKYTNVYGTHEVHINSFGATDISDINENSAIISFKTMTFADDVVAGDSFGVITIEIHAFTSEFNLFFYEIGGQLRDEEYPITDGITYFGDWKIMVPKSDTVNAVGTRWVDATFMGYEAKVRINATSVNVRLERETESSEDWPWDRERNYFRVTLADGKVVKSPYVESFGDPMSVEYWGNIEFVNPDDVVKIELFDEVVFDHTGG